MHLYVEAIKKFRDNDTSEMIKKARADVEDHYNSGYLCDRYRELYLEYATK